jgi:hypothetical protein
MMLDCRISTDRHRVRVAVENTCGGWDVREEVDELTVRLDHYEDWHRVERAMQMRELEESRTRLISAGSRP